MPPWRFPCFCWWPAARRMRSRHQPWVEDEVSFDADGLTIHGTYRHQKDAARGPGGAADLGERQHRPQRRQHRRRQDRQHAPARRVRCPTAATRACATTRSAPARPAWARTSSGPPTSAVPSTPPAPRPRCASSPTSPAPTRPALGVRASARARSTRCRWRRTPSPDAPKIHSLGLLQPLSGPLPGHHHQPGALRREPGDAEHLAGRRRRGPHQRHRARATCPRDSAPS